MKNNSDCSLNDESQHQEKVQWVALLPDDRLSVHIVIIVVGDVLVIIWQMTYDQFHYQFLRFFLTYKPVFLLRQITSLSHYSAVAFVAHQLVLRCVPSKWSWSLQWYGLHCSELVQSCDKFWSSISH